MKHYGLITLVSAISMSLTPACGSKENGDKAGKGAEGAQAAKQTPETLAYKPIGAFGIEAQVPADAEVEDNTKSAGFPMATLWASPTVFVTGQNDLFWPADVEAAKREIEKEPNPFKEFTKEQVTDTGFHLEYTLESMMDKAPLYGFRVRSTIGGKLFDCHTNSQSEQERAAAMAICASLRPAN
jgi:hypothetical protein